MSALPARVTDPFAEAHDHFRKTESFLTNEAFEMSHCELERELLKQGQELMRKLLQAHLDIRGPGEAAGAVKGSDGIVREQERLNERGLETIFGEVTVARAGYGAAGTDPSTFVNRHFPEMVESDDLRHNRRGFGREQL